MKLVINIDGGSRGNPGPAAYGCYIQREGEPPLELKGKLGRTTNNVAEYHGLIRALETAVELGAKQVHIRSDSELLVRQMKGIYRVKHANILPLYHDVRSLIKRIGAVTFEHVYREQNVEADRLCNEALDDPTLPIEPLGQGNEQLFLAANVSRAGRADSREHGRSKPRQEYARVKLAGTLMALLSPRRQKQFAVFVRGSSWKLDLMALPEGVVPGDQVEVVGEITAKKSGPVVKVKRLKKA
jgi:ribonuclease HI